MKFITTYFVLFYLLLGCTTKHGKLKLITKLPKKLKENSGIVSYSKETAWFIEDNGNSDNIYKTDFKGNIIQHLDIKNTKNIDWEDLTKDKDGNLYIGDFGNNSNTRKDLVILKLPNPEIEKGNKIKTEAIHFNFPEQKEFPPNKNGLFYDAEAFFHFDEHLYIFTKNRATPFTGETYIYKVQDEKGTYRAKFLAKIKLCTDKETCRVTSADISPDGEKIVLLSYGKIWILKDFIGGDTSKLDIQEIDLGVRTQLESVCFTSNNTLLLSDEKRDDTGGNLYSYEIKD